jgi:hypothetical protein
VHAKTVTAPLSEYQMRIRRPIHFEARGVSARVESTRYQTQHPEQEQSKKEVPLQQAALPQAPFYRECVLSIEGLQAHRHAL